MSAHLSTCRECSLAVTELRQLSLAPLPEVPPALLDRARRMEARRDGEFRLAPQWKLAGAAAVAFVATLLGVWLAGSGEVGSRAGSGEVRTVRGGTAGDPVPTIVSPRQDAVLPGQAVEIGWTEVSGAITYEVVLVDAEGGLVESLSAGDSLSVSSRTKLRLGTYFVSVAATMPDGRVVKSGFSRFTVRLER